MQIFDTVALIKAGGYLGLFAIVFSETGLLVGILLPGDSMLFTAGFLAATGYLDISLVILITFIAAVLGDSVGYALGKKYGPKIFRREESLFFNKEHVKRAELFYEHHGGKTLVMARFIPIVRTLAPIVAGVGHMRYQLFAGYNVLGGALWTFGLGLFGYFFGKVVPNADEYVLPIVIGILIISILPSAISVLRNREQRAHLMAMLKGLFGGRA